MLLYISDSSAEILEQSTGARNRVGLSYRPARLRNRFLGSLKVLKIPELEFLKRLWGLGTGEEEGYRTGPPGYIGWRNSFLGIDSGAPYTFKNTSSAMGMGVGVNSRDCKNAWSSFFIIVPCQDRFRFNMEIDLQSLFGLSVNSCMYSLAETPQHTPHPPVYLGSYTRVLFVSQDRRYLFVTYDIRYPSHYVLFVFMQ
jgi:hypothetical protein